MKKPQEDKIEKRVRIGIGGDLMLGGSVLEKIIKNGSLFPFEKVIGKLPAFDLFFANLECTLSTTGNPPYPSKILLHSDQKAIKGLKAAGINIVSLANNHAFDYGLEGFLSTKKILKKKEIKSVGGGQNLHEASQQRLLELNGIKLSLLGYCSKESGCRHFASNTEYGVADVKATEMHKDIRRAKSISDIVIVSLHWGEEFRDYPAPKNIKIAHDLIRNGANIVVGHHAHVFQGYEHYMNGLIIYDLGSFIFGDIIQKGNQFRLKKRTHKEGIIAECILNKNGLTNFKFIPVYINHNCQATVPQFPIKNRIIDRFYKQSERIKMPNYKTFYIMYYLKVKSIEMIYNFINMLKKLFTLRNWYRLTCRIFNKIPC